ncbi:PREDICTED: uncharacterized protein LOC101382511 [Odobenus rosmarus divergens]|uniref:Uncharacterized protein LOC101382511 n=1 Tax=Odobenus rosmarus divergens TaxID=9708 RepID=A0A9B0HD29_ODORO
MACPTELFPRPKLEVTPPQPTEGGPVNLSCQTRLPLERSDALLSFIFFRDRRVLLSNWSRSPELQITAIWREDSGSYWCAATAGVPSIHKHSLPMQVRVQGVPVSAVLLETQPQGGQVLAGERLVLVCSVAEGTGNTTFFWHREDTGQSVGSKRQRSQRAELEIPAVGGSHAGRYYCTADNGHGLARSRTLIVTVAVPASCPVLTLRTPGTRAVVGDVVELRCEAQSGSPPILYRFYHEKVTLWSSSSPSGGGVSFNLSLTTEHSGNYACEADNGLGAQRSEALTLSITVPASRPVLTLRAPGAQAVVGDVVELRCEAQSGSPPILYRFYHENVTLGSSSAPSGGGVSFNLSLTPEHSGNYSCEADNGLGPQRSEAVPLSISGLTGSRSGPIASGVAGGLLGMVGLAVLAQLLYCWLPRRAGGRPTSDPSRSPSDSDPQEPTYYNVPGWMELQPVYSNVNPKGGDVVYSEVRMIQEGNRHAVASNSALRLLRTYLPSHGPATSQQRLSGPQGSSVIYSQVKAWEKSSQEQAGGAAFRLLVATLLETGGLDRCQQQEKHPAPRHGSPRLRREWVNFQDRFEKRVHVHNITTLKIDNLTLEDSGRYVARVSYMRGRQYDQDFHLSVYEPVPLPQIRGTILSLTPAWCNVTVECDTNGTREDLTVSWESEGLSGELEQRPSPGPAPNYWSLAVNLPLTQPSTSLTCVVSNQVDQKTATRDLGDVCGHAGSAEHLLQDPGSRPGVRTPVGTARSGQRGAAGAAEKRGTNRLAGAAQGIQGGSVRFHVIRNPELPPEVELEKIAWGIVSRANYIVMLQVFPGRDVPEWVNFRDKFEKRVHVLNITTLRIDNLTLEDSGRYRARESYRRGREYDLDFHLRVYEPMPLPQIRGTVLSLTPAWCNVTVECDTTGTRENRTVSWESEGLSRELEQRPSPGPAPNYWSLAVNLPLTQPNSSLTCVVSNQVDQKTATRDLGDVCGHDPIPISAGKTLTLNLFLIAELELGSA